jgi:inosine-uridine nucleoside N-ribohydrolase
MGANTHGNLQGIERLGLLLLTVLGLLASHATVAGEPRKVIIDCDPGIDDAIALILAVQAPELEILGVTTIFGNASIEQATKNALRIVKRSGKHIPVYQGAAKPLSVPLGAPPDFVHGRDGMGNTEQPEPSRKAETKPAAQFLVEAAKAQPGEVTILAIGRLSNLAEAIRLDSGFVKNVREVVIMGGALYVPGNVSPVAEANIQGDPHAADLVLTTPWKVTMVGLDVTTKVTLNEETMSRVRDGNERYGPFLYSITRFYEEFYRNSGVTAGFYPHDPCAVMYVMEPALFEIKRGPMRVVCEGIAIGQTIMAAYDYQFELPPWRGQPLVSATINVDSKRFEATIERRLLGRR